MAGRTTVRREQEHDVGAEQAAERAVELEADIREARNRAREEADVNAEYDLRLQSFRGRLHSPQLRAARVVEVSRSGSRVHIRFDDGEGGVERGFLPYPDDPTDPSEPLVRLCRWANTPVERVGDLNRVPVTYGDNSRIYAPAGLERRRVRLHLPGDRTVTPVYASLRSRLDRRVEQFQRFLVASPFADGPLDDCFTSPFKAMAAGVLLPLPFLFPVYALASAVGVVAVAGLHFLLLVGFLVVCGDIAMNKPFDTY